MSNTRPPLNRKHTRKTVENADAELDRGIAITDDDGTRLQVRIRDVRGTHDAQLVALIGLDFTGLLEQLARRQGLDLLAALLWFARLVNGRDPGDYAALLEEVGYGDYLERDVDEPTAEDDAPKAPASSS